VLPGRLCCPKCRATEGQRRLTVRELERLKPSDRAEIAANFDAAQRCGSCGAAYVYSAAGLVVQFRPGGPKR
jgi:hypothetical protein